MSVAARERPGRQAFLSSCDMVRGGSCDESCWVKGAALELIMTGLVCQSPWPGKPSTPGCAGETLRRHGQSGGHTRGSTAFNHCSWDCWLRSCWQKLCSVKCQLLPDRSPSLSELVPPSREPAAEASLPGQDGGQPDMVVCRWTLPHSVASCVTVTPFCFISLWRAWRTAANVESIFCLHGAALCLMQMWAEAACESGACFAVSCFLLPRMLAPHAGPVAFRWAEGTLCCVPSI